MLTIIGLILFAFAVLFELFAALTGRWSTGYNWVLAVIGGLILAVQLRRRDRKLERWIDVGLPDEKDIRRACNRSRHVVVLSYGGRGAEIWWQQTAGKVAGQKNLRVLSLTVDEGQALAGLAQRTMRLQCTIQEGLIWLGDDERQVELKPEVLFDEAQG